MLPSHRRHTSRQPQPPISPNPNPPGGLVSIQGRKLETSPQVEEVVSSGAISGVGPEARTQSAAKQRSQPPAALRSSHGAGTPGHTQVIGPSHAPCHMLPSPVGPQVPSSTRGLPHPNPNNLDSCSPPSHAIPPSMPGHQSPTINTAHGGSDIILNIQSFNCKGFKSSFDYVFYLLDSCDIMCLSETWLRPEEQHCIGEMADKMALSNKIDSVFSKSTMTDIGADYRGRPFCGISMICNKYSSFKYHEMDIPSDRLQAVCISDNSGKPVQIVVNVYMPFYNGTSGQSELFAETMDILQGFIDCHANEAPIKILGDFNAQLPKSDKLHKRWFKSKGFNEHNAMLYDFVAGNDFLVTGLMFTQDTNHTYFCHTSGKYTWIDHILCSKHDSGDVISCKIIDHHPSNRGDHLPLSVSFRVATCSPGGARMNRGYQTASARIKWEAPGVASRYLDAVKNNLSSL